MPSTMIKGPSNIAKLHNIGGVLIVDLVEGFPREGSLDAVYTGVDGGSGFITCEAVDKT